MMLEVITGNIVAAFVDYSAFEMICFCWIKKIQTTVEMSADWRDLHN